jgi:hypothetical protein
VDKSKKRKITDLMEDAMSGDDYKLMGNLLVSGLMFENPDQESKKNCNDMLLELMHYCERGNSTGEKNDYLIRTADRIRKYLGEQK